MNCLYIGLLNGVSNTCVHRSWAMQRIAEKVDFVDTYHPMTPWYRATYHFFVWGLPVRVPDLTGANKKIIQNVDKYKYDVFWIDKGITIYPETLSYIKEKQPNAAIVSYSPDNMAMRHNQTQQYKECIPLYDYLVTTKSYILDDMKQLGAKNIIFVDNAYEEKFHHIYELTDDDMDRLCADVGFVGSYEKERCQSLLYLADNGIKVTVWGTGKEWLRYKNYNEYFLLKYGGLFSEDYSKSFQATKISMCFLKKMNFDQQTTRTVEIPACGGFMMAERTDEHKALFEENKEAVFFSSNEELLEKCRYYLEHDDERKAIAKAGHKRCIESDYSNYGMIKRVLNQII